MATLPIRVPEEVHHEVRTAARVLGCSTSALLARAWAAYSRSGEFVRAFEQAQEALADGHLEAVALRLRKEESADADDHQAPWHVPAEPSVRTEYGEGDVSGSSRTD